MTARLMHLIVYVGFDLLLNLTLDRLTYTHEKVHEGQFTLKVNNPGG